MSFKKGDSTAARRDANMIAGAIILSGAMFVGSASYNVIAILWVLIVIPILGPAIVSWASYRFENLLADTFKNFEKTSTYLRQRNILQ
jgi:hypothetical protein